MFDVLRLTYYVYNMIRSFRDRATRDFYETGRTRKGWQSAARIALRKLDQLNASWRLEQLANPPGNRLEVLRHDRAGQHSIRINDQWRVCFEWRDGDAYEVEICDYH